MFSKNICCRLEVRSENLLLKHVILEECLSYLAMWLNLQLAQLLSLKDPKDSVFALSHCHTASGEKWYPAFICLWGNWDVGWLNYPRPHNKSIGEPSSTFLTSSCSQPHSQAHSQLYSPQKGEFKHSLCTYDKSCIIYYSTHSFQLLWMESLPLGICLINY